MSVSKFEHTYHTYDIIWIIRTYRLCKRMVFYHTRTYLGEKSLSL